MSCEYPNICRITYSDEDTDFGIAYFVPVCPQCGQFIKADNEIEHNLFGVITAPNATCSKCGRVAMPFEGWF